MPIKQIPFTRGQSEAADAKMLPDGLFSAVVNARYRRDARIGSRYGYDYQPGWRQWETAGSHNTGVPTFQGRAGAQVDAQRSVWITQRTGNGISGAPEWVIRNADGSYGLFNNLSSGVRYQFPGVTDLAGVSRSVGINNLKNNAASCDMAYVSGLLFVAVSDGETGGVNVAAIDRSGATLRTWNIVADASPNNSGNNVRCCVCGTKLCVAFYMYDGSRKIAMAVLDTALLDNTFALSNPVVTAGAFGAFDMGAGFDIATHNSTTIVLAYWKGGGDSSIGTVTTTFPFTYTEKATFATTEASYTIASDGTVAMVAYINATNVLAYRSLTVASSTLSSATTIGAGFIAFPAMSYVNSAFWLVVAVNGGGGAPSSMVSYKATAGGSYFFGSSLVGLAGLWPASRPFLAGVGVYCWAIDVAGDNGVSAFTERTYSLLDVTNSDGICEAVAGQTLADLGLTALSVSEGGVGGWYEPRRAGWSIPAIVSDYPTPGTSFAVVALPVKNGPESWMVESDIVWIEMGDFGAAAKANCDENGVRYFAGPRQYAFDGSQMIEDGLRFGPIYMATSAAGGGFLADGTYEYTSIFTWEDAQGLKHRSPPCNPVTVIISGGAGAGTVNVDIQRIPFTLKADQQFSTPLGLSVEVYRTLADGSIFYLTGTANIQALPDNSYAGVTDGLIGTADADIRTHEVLYTQGDRGGVSGLLPSDEPPPCRFLFAGNNRLIAGGLEVANEVCWSKLIFPGEPLAWSIDPAFRARVSGDVTAVCALDGNWYVATRDAWWGFSGDGPSDNGQGGFSDPVKLPSDVGCISHRSLVETPQGIFFQGRSDRIYLLPRGSNNPQWIGQAVRATLVTYPFVSAAILVQEENCVYFAVTDAAGTTGKLIIYDTRTGEWYTDTFYTRAIKSLAVHNGVLMVDGYIAQTPGFYADDDTGLKADNITWSVTMGDVRPQGPLAQGRILNCGVVGECITAGVLSISTSTDSGGSFTTPDAYTVNSAGVFERQSQLANVRTDVVRPRFSVVTSDQTEGLVLNAAALDIVPAERTKRLPAASRL